MKVTAERIPEAQIVLEIEIDEKQTKRSLDQAARRLAQRYRIPGFRKGKAPRRVIENTLGADAVFEEAAERLIPKAYDDAVEQEGLEPVGAPDLEILDRDPVRFKATVPLPPIVDMGDYKGISVEKETAEVTEEMIGDTLLQLQRQHAILEPVDRPVEFNDHLRMDVRAEADGEQIMSEEGVEFSLREDTTVAVPGFGEKLVGLEKGPEHEVSVDVPDDHDDAEVAGKTVTFLVTIHDIKNEELPELDDDFASEVGEHETFVELREKVEADLNEAAEQRIASEFHDKVIQAVMKKVSVEFAPAMIDHELEHMMGEMAQQSGQNMDSYMEMLGPAATQIRESMRGRAADRVLNTIVLSEAAVVEEIEVSEEDIEAEIDKMVGDTPQAEQLRAIFDNENSREMIKRNVVTRQTLDALGAYATKNFAAGVPSDIDEGDDDDGGDDDGDEEEVTEQALDAESDAPATDGDDEPQDGAED